METGGRGSTKPWADSGHIVQRLLPTYSVEKLLSTGRSKILRLYRLRRTTGFEGTVH